MDSKIRKNTAKNYTFPKNQLDIGVGLRKLVKTGQKMDLSFSIENWYDGNLNC